MIILFFFIQPVVCPAGQKPFLLPFFPILDVQLPIELQSAQVVLPSLVCICSYGHPSDPIRYTRSRYICVLYMCTRFQPDISALFHPLITLVIPARKFRILLTCPLFNTLPIQRSLYFNIIIIYHVKLLFLNIRHSYRVLKLSTTRKLRI